MSKKFVGFASQKMDSRNRNWIGLYNWEWRYLLSLVLAFLDDDFSTGRTLGSWNHYMTYDWERNSLNELLGFLMFGL